MHDGDDCDERLRSDAGEWFKVGGRVCACGKAWEDGWGMLSAGGGCMRCCMPCTAGNNCRCIHCKCTTSAEKLFALAQQMPWVAVAQ